MPIDLLSRSESPRVQQLILHQKLKEEIEKNSSGRVRYVDSELYLRSNLRSPAAEVQSTTLDIGVASPSKSTGQSSGKLLPNKRISADIPSSKRPEIDQRHAGFGDLGLGSTTIEGSDETIRGESQPDKMMVNKNCQVCLIREVRQDLMNINKIVQERNEQISKLKAKCLRSYFERQMME